MEIIRNDNSVLSGDQIHYWFGDLNPSGWAVSSSNPEILLNRVKKIGQDLHSFPSWEDGVSSGFCGNKNDYFSNLRNLCLLWSQEVLQLHCSSEEAQLIRLVRVLREVDHMISRLSEQIIIWNQMTTYGSGVSASKSLSDPLVQASEFAGEYACISELTRDISRLKGSRSHLAELITAKSQNLLPNCSTLVGPLVAARILAASGGRENLARMPASGIQILGARNALFSHLTKGSPPPKHGLIFEHKRVHAAPRRLRGKVSRAVSSNLAIAARIDYFRGSFDEDFLEKATRRIERAGRIS